MLCVVDLFFSEELCDLRELVNVLVRCSNHLSCVRVLYYLAWYGLSAFEVYFQGGQALVNGTALYQGTSGWIYLYPPLTAQMLIPLAEIMDYDAAALFWLAANFAILIGTVALLANYVPASQMKWLWISPILFFPIAQAFYIGQITVIMLALVALAWFAIRHDQRGWAGALLAFAAWIKVFPALLVVYFFLKRDWRVIRGVVITGIGLALLQIIISGPGVFLAFFEVLFELTSDGQPAATYENSSIFAFASRLFQNNARVYPLVINETLYAITRISLTLMVFGLAGYAIYRSGADTRLRTLSWRFDLEYGLVLLTILLFGSTLWISGMPPLFLIYVMIWRNQHVFRRSRLVRWLNRFSFAAITLYIPMMLLFMHDGSSMHALPLSLGFFGVMALWALLVILLLQNRKGASA